MAKNPDDYEIDPAELEEVADNEVNLNAFSTTQSFVIIAQLDPTEVQAGQPRWSTQQQTQIARFRDALRDAE